MSLKDIDNIERSDVCVKYSTIYMYLCKIIQTQNIIIDQISSISKVLADNLDLPIEEGECDIDEIIRVNK